MFPRFVSEVRTMLVLVSDDFGKNMHRLPVIGWHIVLTPEGDLRPHVVTPRGIELTDDVVGYEFPTSDTQCPMSDVPYA